MTKPIQETIKINDLDMPLMNGNEDYVPELDENYYFDKHAEHVCHDINSRAHVMLVGHTGCGKTSVVDQIAARMHQPIMRVNMNGQTTIGDFVGLWTVKGGETVWIDGALPMAMRNGYWLLIDEIDFAEAPILSVLNPLLEKGGKLLLKEKGHEVVKPHPNFRVFATANTVGCMQRFRSLYQGTNLMNEAWLDRWHVYHVDYLKPKQEIDIITKKFPAIDKPMATQIVKVATMAREAFRIGDIQASFSTRRLLDWTEMMMRYGDPVTAASMTIYAKVSDEDRDVLEGLITRNLLTPQTPAQTVGSTARAAQTAGATRPASKTPIR